MKYPVFWPRFYTATTLEWKPLLKHKKYKNVVIVTLSFLVNEKRNILYALVTMSIHLHLIWQLLNDFTPEKFNIVYCLLLLISLKLNLELNHSQVLSHFKVKAKDKNFQYWIARI